MLMTTAPGVKTTKNTGTLDLNIPKKLIMEVLDHKYQ